MIIWDIILGFPCEIQIINYVMNHHDDYAEHNSEFKGEIQRDQNQFYDFHFFKSASTLEKKKSAVFSYPSTLLPDWQSSTSWTKINPWKCSLRTQLSHVIIAISPSIWIMTLRHTCFSMMERRPQLQPVRLLKHQSFSSKKTHAGSQWREAFCLHTVQLLLHTSCPPQAAHANPFRRKTFQLHTM